MELTANGNMFYPIVKLFGTWILRKRLAEGTFKFYHNNMENCTYTNCVGVIPPTQSSITHVRIIVCALFYLNMVDKPQQSSRSISSFLDGIYLIMTAHFRLQCETAYVKECFRGRLLTPNENE